MSVLSLVIVLCIIGFVIYMLMTAPIPIHPWIRTMIIGIICIALILWVMAEFGLNTGIHMRLT